MLTSLLIVSILLADAEVTMAPRPLARVAGYSEHYAQCAAAECGRALIQIRSFVLNGRPSGVFVDPQSLATEVRPVEGLRRTDLGGGAALPAVIGNTPWGRALVDAVRNAAARQDAGVVHILPPGQGVYLTIDLCPSKHRLDRQLFRTILDAFEPEERPVPLGVAITGAWMREHPDDLAWLTGLVTKGEISVTWINHSDTHRYDKTAPLVRNFLLRPGTDLRGEVLGAERAMIERGLVPSVFFRFPGLVSAPDLVGRVAALGLVSIGSDAWLAKKQEPGPGSIVLVHGNGNEPYGVRRFLDLLKRERSDIRARHFLLFDLREALSEAEATPRPR